MSRVPAFACAVALLLLAGCAASYRDVNKILDEAVGKPLSQVNLRYPYRQMTAAKQSNEKTTTFEYWYDGSVNCKWAFVVSNADQTVQSWYYVNATAESNCQYMALTRP